MYWPWAQIEPYYQELAGQSLEAANLAAWLAGWSQMRALLAETFNRLYVAITRDTTDENAQAQYNRFLDEIYPRAQSAEQALKQKLLSSGLEPEGFAVALQNMRSEASLFRAENLPLLAEELKLAAEYDRIIGAQTVPWDGEELTLQQLQPVFQDPDRERRERAWRLAAERQLQDRQAIDELWSRFMALRGKLAANAGLPGYRAYRWQQLLRHAYTPEDCKRFHAAVETVVVPAAQRIYERRRQRLGV